MKRALYLVENNQDSYIARNVSRRTFDRSEAEISFSDAKAWPRLSIVRVSQSNINRPPAKKKKK